MPLLGTRGAISIKGYGLTAGAGFGAPYNIDYLILGGGGGGGSLGGGGGAGGQRSGTVEVLTNAVYTITVGIC